jgi:electron transfer flavoprotein alpha subunit
MSRTFILADFFGEASTKTTAELATTAARIGDVTAVVLAPVGKGAAMAATVNVGPIASVIVVESADFATHGVAAMADALSQLVTTHAPVAVLIASHAMGKEIAARVAVATNSGIITDAQDVAADRTLSLIHI